MRLYFAYGSNMDRDAMKRRCPEARALGPAVLEGYRFFVGREGWGSVRRSPGSRVHGVLWKVSPRDMAALHAYELRPGYVEAIAGAARGWHLPQRYIAALERLAA